MLRREDSPGTRPTLLLVLAALVAVCVFDLSVAAPISYEAGLRASLTAFAAGAGLHPPDDLAPIALVQLLVTAPLALLHADPRWWRLSVVAFLVLGGVCARRLARLCGANQVGATFAAALVLCSPLTLALATGFMTDDPYLGLVLAASYFAVRYRESGRGIVPLCAFVAAATVQRQYGATITAALTLALLVEHPATRRRAAAAWHMLALWAVTIASLGLPVALGLVSENARHVLTTVARPYGAHLAGTALELPVMLGLLLVPAVGAMILARRGETVRSRVVLAPFALAACGLTTAAFFSWQGGFIFPGDWLAPSGLTPQDLPGPKPSLFGSGFFVVEALAVLALTLALVKHGPAWDDALRDPPRRLVLVLALFQLPAVALDSVIDRHYLPALALVVISFAASLPGWRGASIPRRSATWTVNILLAAAVATFVAGEQDALAWRAAAAAMKARSGAAQLELVPNRDPRAGIQYRSLAPGKVVRRHG